MEGLRARPCSRRVSGDAAWWTCLTAVRGGSTITGIFLLSALYPPFHMCLIAFCAPSTSLSLPSSADGIYYITVGVGCCACRGGSNIVIYTATNPLGPYTLVGDVVGACTCVAWRVRHYCAR